MEDFCCPRPTQPLRLPAAQSPTMAETLHPAFSGVQQYTGRETSRPCPRVTPPLTEPAPGAWPLSPSSPSYAPSPPCFSVWSRSPEPTFSPAPHIFHRLCQNLAPSLAVLPKACLGHSFSSWPRPSSPGPAPLFVALAPPLGPFLAVATPLLFPITRVWPRPHIWPLPRISSAPLCLSPAPPTSAPTDLTPTSTPGLCSHVPHRGHHAHRAQRPPAAAPPAAAAAARR